MPGFSDSLLGVLGMTAGMMVGLLRVTKAEPDSFIDAVPADIVRRKQQSIDKKYKQIFTGYQLVVGSCG